MSLLLEVVEHTISHLQASHTFTVTTIIDCKEGFRGYDVLRSVGMSRAGETHRGQKERVFQEEGQNPEFCPEVFLWKFVL